MPFGCSKVHACSIAWEHYKVHVGKRFHVSEIGSVGNVNSANLYLIVTPTSADIHLTYDATVTAKTLIRLYEGASIATGSEGTELTIFNRNRKSDNTNGMTVYTRPIVPDVDSLGTSIFDEIIPAGKSSGGVSRFDVEFILKNNMSYVLWLEGGTADVDYSVGLDWYDGGVDD
jgi:hypothetical protein